MPDCPFCHQPTDGPCQCKGARESREIEASNARQDAFFRTRPRGEDDR